MHMIVSEVPAKSASIEAIVFNADGTVKKDLGVIAYWHRDPLKRLWFQLTGRMWS